MYAYNIPAHCMHLLHLDSYFNFITYLVTFTPIQTSSHGKANEQDEQGSNIVTCNDTEFNSDDEFPPPPTKMMRERSSEIVRA